MAAIRAALNLEHGGVKDFYICSLSSRCLFQIADIFVLVNFDLTLQFHCNEFSQIVQDCCLQRSAEAHSIEGLLLCRSWQ